MQVLHQPIRVYIMDMDRRKAYDKVVLNEVSDFASALGYGRFVITPCTVDGRAFNIVKMDGSYDFLPVSSADAEGNPVTYGNIMFLGYSEDGHRGLTDEEVIYIEQHITMTIGFSKTLKTHYVVNDVRIVEMEE